MPYTTQGFMTSAEVADLYADSDLGSILVSIDDAPEWFDASIMCPVCGKAVWNHESVTVVRASGEIFACEIDGERTELPYDIGYETYLIS
jgi:hypothetical protein